MVEGRRPSTIDGGQARGRGAVPTGASAGAGRATARALARRGWSLGLVSRGREGLAATRDEAEETGVRAIAVPADVADAAAVDEAAERVEQQLGPIDAWINNNAMASRRSMWVGPSTVSTIVANAIAPGLLDRFLARTGYRARQTSQPRDPTRPDNLDAPVGGYVGAHGAFGERAHPRTVQLWASKCGHELAEAAVAGASRLVAASGVASGGT
jgi:hypothetical protein